MPITTILIILIVAACVLASWYACYRLLRLERGTNRPAEIPPRTGEENTRRIAEKKRMAAKALIWRAESSRLVKKARELRGLSIAYDATRDILTVDGVDFPGDTFRTIGVGLCDKLKMGTILARGWVEPTSDEALERYQAALMVAKSAGAESFKFGVTVDIPVWWAEQVCENYKPEGPQ